MTKIVLSGYILVPDSDLTAVRQALPQHIAATRAEPGCLVFKVEQDRSERGKFDVYEEFVDHEAFEFHQQRVRQSDWGRISRGIQRNYTVEGFSAGAEGEGSQHRSHNQGK